MPTLRAIVRGFVVYNPLFLLSAMLILGGTLLVSPPDDSGRRSLELLARLLEAIVAYEATLLGAAYLLARRPGLGRDVRGLVLVLGPFLTDVTFTKSALATALLHVAGGWAAAGAALALLAASLAEGVLASRAAGLRFTPLGWAALAAGPLIATVYPIGARLVSGEGPFLLPGDGVVFLAGVALAALALLLAAAVAEGAPGAAAIRRLAPIALAATAWHAGAMTWTFERDIWLLAGPLAIALGPAVPRLAWPSRADFDRVTPFVFPIAGALICGSAGTPSSLRADAPSLGGISLWNLGLGGLAVVHAVMAVRFRSVRFCAGVAAAALLCAGGPTIEASLASLGHNRAEPALLLGLFAYGVWRRAGPVALGLPLLAGALLVARHLPPSELRPVASLDIIGAGLLAATHRAYGSTSAGLRARLVGMTLLFAPSAFVGLGVGNARLEACWILAGTALALLGLGLTLRVREYLAPALVAPLALAVRSAPATASGWGVVGIGAAFVIVALGVALSLARERIVVWLDGATTSEDDRSPPTVRTATDLDR